MHGRVSHLLGLKKLHYVKFPYLVNRSERADKAAAPTFEWGTDAQDAHVRVHVMLRIFLTQQGFVDRNLHALVTFSSSSYINPVIGYTFARHTCKYRF